MLDVDPDPIIGALDPTDQAVIDRVAIETLSGFVDFEIRPAILLTSFVQSQLECSGVTVIIKRNANPTLLCEGSIEVGSFEGIG